MIFYSDTFQRRKATPNTCKNLDKSPREKRKSKTEIQLYLIIP